jgi:hypothetical protein
LVAVIRPLHAEELAEIFAIDFDPKAEPNLLEGWHPDNPKEAVLSAGSTLITIIEPILSHFGEKILDIGSVSGVGTRKYLPIPHSSRCCPHCSRAGTAVGWKRRQEVLGNVSSSVLYGRTLG